MLALWSGLGYYSRARNLRRGRAADRGGRRFPARLRRHPRAARASATIPPRRSRSIAFDLPYAVLDGNVLRVVARVDNDAADIVRRPHARTLPRDRAAVAGPARARPLQPGADGTRRHGLPAAQSALPGLSAYRLLRRARRKARRRNCP